MRKLILLIVLVAAVAGGIAAGEMLRPPIDRAPHADADTANSADIQHAQAGSAWFTFPNQFFVPMMRNGDMGAVMVLTLTVEIEEPDLVAMQQQQHRMRDALLRQLMIHANTGGFDGNFTSDARLRNLRGDLLTAAKGATNLAVNAILIEDISRQGR